jgi:hypothetical protein
MNKKKIRLSVRLVFWFVTFGILCVGALLTLYLFLPQAARDRWEEKGVDTLILIAATFVGAWAGGAAAFRVERRTQETSARSAQISAANKAIFAIAAAYQVYENLRAFFIDVNGSRNHPQRALKIDSPQPGMLERISFDFDALSFLLDQSGEASSQIVMELMLFQWKYQVLYQTIEHRASAAQECHRAVTTNPPADRSLAGIMVAFPGEYQKLDATTEQFIASVDDGLQNCVQLNSKFQAVLQQLFPGQNFLQINFAGGALQNT